MLDKVERTPRGFQRIEFEDQYGEKCSIQQSSHILNDKPGTGALWLGMEKGTHVDGQCMARMHLPRDQVGELIKRLSEWYKTGELKGEIKGKATPGIGKRKVKF